MKGKIFLSALAAVAALTVAAEGFKDPDFELSPAGQLKKWSGGPWILLTQIGEYGTWAKMRFVLKGVDHVREARDAALRAVSPYTRLSAAEILHDDGEED